MVVHAVRSVSDGARARAQGAEHLSAPDRRLVSRCLCPVSACCGIIPVGLLAVPVRLGPQRVTDSPVRFPDQIGLHDAEGRCSLAGGRAGWLRLRLSTFTVMPGTITRRGAGDPPAGLRHLAAARDEGVDQLVALAEVLGHLADTGESGPEPFGERLQDLPGVLADGDPALSVLDSGLGGGD